jgi:hypothetical protein
VKKSILIGLIFVSGSLFVSLPASSSTFNSDTPEYPQETYGGIGACIATSPEAFSSYWGPGFEGNFGQNIGMKIPDYMITVMAGARMDLGFFPFNIEKLYSDSGVTLPTGINVSGGDATLYNITGIIKVVLDKFPSPYISLGLGLCRVLTSDLTMSDNLGNKQTLGGSGSENAFSLAFNGGVRIGNVIAFTVEPGYVIAFTKENSTQYFAVRVGVSYIKQEE